MINFYDILCIKPSATAGEIKSAFRSLAKLYHPDKNPLGQEEFKKILRAYETLNNASRKATYDLKLKYHQAGAVTPRSSTKKNWSFDEKELKRRQYYDDHIKKYEKIKTAKAAHAQLKTNYNEYKYILFATPLAVALFLLIVNLAGSPEPKDIELKNKKTAIDSKRILKMGDSPYAEYFGEQKYYKAENKNLTIKNNTGLDIVVCLFNKRGFLRSCYIQDGFFAEIPQLPKNDLDVRYSAGSNWDFGYELKEAKIYGAFTKELSFYKSAAVTGLGAMNEITLLNGSNEGFKPVKEKEFFNKDI